MVRRNSQTGDERDDREPWNLGTLEPWNLETLKPWNPETYRHGDDSFRIRTGAGGFLAGAIGGR